MLLLHWFSRTIHEQLYKAKNRVKAYLIFGVRHLQHSFYRGKQIVKNILLYSKKLLLFGYIYLSFLNKKKKVILKWIAPIVFIIAAIIKILLSPAVLGRVADMMTVHSWFSASKAPEVQYSIEGYQTRILKLSKFDDKKVNKFLEEIDEKRKLYEDRIKHARIFFDAAGVDFIKENYRGAAENYKNSLKEFPTKSTYRNYGISLFLVPDLEQAEDAFLAGADFSRQEGDQKSEAEFITSIGDVYQEQRRYEEAFHSYQQALERMEQDDILEKANILSSIGALCINKGDPSEAINYFEKAIEIYDQMKDYDRKINAMLNMSTAKDDPREALTIINSAEQLIDKIDDPRKKSNIFKKKEYIYFTLGEWQKALESSRKAKSYLKKADKSSADVIRDLLYISKYEAFVYYHKGEYEEALKILKQVENRYANIHGYDNINKQRILIDKADVLQLTGLVYTSKNNFKDALIYYERAKEIVENINHWRAIRSKVVILQSIMYMYLAQGNDELAEKYSQQVIKLTWQSKAPEGKNNVLDTANTLQPRDWNKEISDYQEALEFYKKEISDTGAQIVILNNLGAVYLNIGEEHSTRENWKDALESYIHALNYYGEAKNAYGQATVFYYIGTLFTLQKKWENALESYEKALELYKGENDSLREKEISGLIESIKNKMIPSKEYIMLE